jgi:hypothetical protein
MVRSLTKITYTFFTRDQAAAEELIEELDTVISNEIDGLPTNKKTGNPALAIVDRYWTKTTNEDPAFLDRFFGPPLYTVEEITQYSYTVDPAVYKVTLVLLVVDEQLAYEVCKALDFDFALGRALIFTTFVSAYWTLTDTDTNDPLYSEVLSEIIFGKLSKEHYHGLY